ncbi:MAG: homoserine kinase [Candidatus Synoicihabitans palmerolidicus]|nr:homoserine kinase [Candidatus Synoicihabitans palmerolidicus]
MTTVSVRVPGSTSNCGAGFDTLGMALQLYNTVTLRRQENAGQEPATERDERASEMVADVVSRFEEVTGQKVPGFRFHIDGDVPPARGLGSSVTVSAGVLAGINHWAGQPLTTKAMVSLITAIEGHPDNAAAGVLGGFCVARFGAMPADFVDVVKVEIPDSLRFVVVSPVMEVTTKASRGVLSRQINHLDAVRSVNSAVCLTAAFATGDYEKLRNVVSDFLHEPYRLPAIKGAAQAIAAGVEAGALTGWLSGSGSSVLGVATELMANSIGVAMQQAFSRVDVASDVRILRADNNGLTVVID